MNENTEIKLTIKLSEIQTLNNFLNNSTPTLPFGTAVQFVNNLSKQIQDAVVELQSKGETHVAPQALRAVIDGEGEE